jgi:2-octaprenylphenol hydroxylase
VAESQSFDVVIVGAGIAGSALALALSGAGFSLALVEARPLDLPALPTERDPAHFDSRVSALTPRSRALLARLGAWDAIAAYRHCSYRHMTVWDAEGTGQIEFDHAEVSAEALGDIVENRAVVGALLEQVLAAPDIATLSPATLADCSRLDDGRMEIVLQEGDRLCAPLVVAADGAQSPLREMLGFHTREWDYGHRAIVATVEVSRSHEHTAWQRFLPTGPLALLPLPGGAGRHFCSIVWSVREELADELLAMDDEAFRGELERASESRLGRVLEISRRFAFPLRQRHAVDYVQPGVALVGDAAHTIHPLAGQGINLGLQDVAALAEELVAAHRRGVEPGELATLQRYQRRRKGENLLMMGAMDGFKRLFEQEALPLRWLRNAGMRGVDRMVPLKRQLMRHAMGLG